MAQGVQVGDFGRQFNTWLVPPREVEWPVQVGVAPATAVAFQPRAALDEVLTAGEGSVVLVGGGGVGKTQLAAAAFRQARATGADLVVWVNASSRASILTAYAKAGAVTGAATGGDAADVPVDEAAERFLGWLATTRRSWLVVLDDVTSAADLHRLWPEGSGGRVVASTRRRDVGPGGARQLAVDVFTVDEARGYLADKLLGSPARPVHPDALTEADELGADLGHLPLALAQAAAVVLDEGTTCAAYRRRFASRTYALDRSFPRRARADDYAHTVATTWELAVEQADRLPPEGLARPALEVAAALAADGAPDLLWATGPVLAHLGRSRDPTGADARAGAEPVTAALARDALRNLHALSLVTHAPTRELGMVTTHPLVHEAVLGRLDGAGRAELVRTVADALVEAWPAAAGHAPVAIALQQSASRVLHGEPEGLWAGRTHDLVFLAGQGLGELGMVGPAVDYWDGAVTTATERLGPHHPDTLAARHCAAYWRGASGDAGGAAVALDRLAADRAQARGPDHADTLAARHSAADWHGTAGDPAAAVASLEELLADRVRVLGADHPDTLSTRYGIARWRGAAGDAAGAAEALGRLAAERARVLGADHADTFSARHGAADWLGAAGDAARAVAELEALLADRARVLGDGAADVLATRHGLARWRGAAGDAAGAAAALAELLADRSARLGGRHPDVLGTAHSLAGWRGAAGDPAGAAAALADVAADRADVLGLDHPDTRSTREAAAFWRDVAAGDGSPDAAAVAVLVAFAAADGGADWRAGRVRRVTRQHIAAR
jgi:hypothetical protein